MMNRTSTLTVLGLLFTALVPPSPVAHANGSPSMDWTFTNDGSGTPCAVLSSPPSFSFGGYGAGPEAPSGCNADYWTGHGEGFLLSPVKGQVEFCASADDFVDVSIGGQLILDNIGGDGGCATLRLNENFCYEIVVDFIEVGGYANFAVSWDASGSQVTMTADDFMQGPCSNPVVLDMDGYLQHFTSSPEEHLPNTQ